MNRIANELADVVEHLQSSQADLGLLISTASTTIAKMDYALKLAKAVLERTGNLDTSISSTKTDGPTIGTIIDRALVAGNVTPEKV